MSQIFQGRVSTFEGGLIQSSVAVEATRLPRQRGTVSSSNGNRARYQEQQDGFVRDIERARQATALVARLHELAGKFSGEIRSYWKGQARLARKLQAAGDARQIVALWAGKV